jgi:hypothetical protein
VLQTLIDFARAQSRGLHSERCREFSGGCVILRRVIVEWR